MKKFGLLRFFILIIAGVTIFGCGASQRFTSSTTSLFNNPVSLNGIIYYGYSQDSVKEANDQTFFVKLNPGPPPVKTYTAQFAFSLSDKGDYILTVTRVSDSLQYQPIKVNVDSTVNNVRVILPPDIKSSVVSPVIINIKSGETNNIILTKPN